MKKNITEEIYKPLADFAYIKDYLLAEYNQLFSEIRYINEKIHAYAKLCFAILSAFIIYTLTGTQVILSNEHGSTMLSLLFGILGLFIAWITFYVIFIGVRQYAVSKKHRIRYWRSIHAIRRLIIQLYPGIKEYILLPTESQLKNENGTVTPRPNVSGGEFFTGIFVVLINYLFIFIFSAYFWIILEISSKMLTGWLIDTKLCNFSLKGEYERATIAAAISSFMILGAATASYLHRALWFYYCSLQTAKVIDHNDLYFSFTFRYSHLLNWKITRWLIYLCLGLLIVIRISIWRDAITPSLFWFWFCLACVFIIFLLQFACFSLMRRILLNKYASQYKFLKDDFISNFGGFTHKKSS